MSARNLFHCLFVGKDHIPEDHRKLKRNQSPHVLPSVIVKQKKNNGAKLKYENHSGLYDFMESLKNKTQKHDCLLHTLAIHIIGNSP